jgi:hypothetical protein
MLRLLCHVLLDQIPDQGMQELLDIMSDLYEFYSSRTEAYTPSLPEPPKLKARVGKAIIRPVFPIIED